MKSEEIQKVKGWMETGANNKKIAIKLRKETGREESVKNVNNLRNLLLSVDQKPLNKMVQTMKDDMALDEGMVVEVVQDQETRMRYCFRQTSQMRAAFEKYPHLMMMDTTYRLISTRYPSLVLVVIDGNFNTVVVGLAILQHETKSTYHEILQLFQSHNEATR